VTDADKVMNHFERDLADILIWINLAIHIGISDQFWLKFWHWQRFALSECSLVVTVIYAVVNRGEVEVALTGVTCVRFCYPDLREITS